MSTQDAKNQKNPYQHTINLPQTDFSLRANAQQKEPEILKTWEEGNLSRKATDANAGNQKFILHDGPPFANGHLHLGHALSYILKDIVCKAKRMQGFHVPLVPGWDCHGLPIEHKVAAEHAIEKNASADDRIAFKKRCREYAQQWIAVQNEELKGLGKLADYEHPYISMSPSYESSVVRVLATFVEKGYIERKLKSVPWCASCKTVLATAEIEYKDRKDPSLYVLFSLPQQTARDTFPFLIEQQPNLSLSLAVWTTTPWTLPLNRAVALNPSTVYVVLQTTDNNRAFIVAKDCAANVCQQLGIPCVELAQADAVALQGLQVQHPFIEGSLVPVILDETVVMGEGTGCLHTAPGCGPEDYQMALRHNLEIFSPLSADGKYTIGIKPVELEGVSIYQGQKWVLEVLQQKGSLLHQGETTHSYPHCWRCHKGLMFRATSQWFCNLQKNDLIMRSLAEIEKLSFFPERARARLHSFIANRAEWCISRQRQWGVPIPAVLCDACGGAWIDAAMLQKVADRVAQEGIEFWDRMTLASLVAEGIVPQDFACQSCGNKDHARFSLERDIVDVWFDSGSSSYAVLAQQPKKLGIPADLYFEGSDQHRGWFQSSLLCGMVLYDHAPMKAIATHGFIVDEHKRKMSKSVGNVIAPQDIITKYSRDVLRMWVASTDYEDDLVISEQLLGNVTEMYRKIRNTCRFLLSNLYDFDVNKDAVDLDKMLTLDQYALATLYDMHKTVMEGYDTYRFSTAIHTINNYCTTTLSAVYLDIIKDRLYVEKADSHARRSAQTAMYAILDVMTRLLAPITSFLAEEVSDYYQKDKKQSIHLQHFIQPLDVWGELPQHYIDEYMSARRVHDDAPANFVVLKQGQWTMLQEVRDAVLKAIEVKRGLGIVKHPYEAVVTLYLDPASKEYELMTSFVHELKAKGESVPRFFKDWFVVSHVEIVESPRDLEPSLLASLQVRIDRAEGVKCPRCWQWSGSQHADGLCERCTDVLEK